MDEDNKNNDQEGQDKEAQQNNDGKGKQQQTGGEQSQNVDVNAVKNEAVQNLLKGLGVQDEDSLKGIIGEYNKHKESQMSDIEKKDAEITRLSQELVAERELRIMAEAKIEGIKLGANKDLIDDLVIIAKSKVTKDKDIVAVLSEMKEGNTVYFKAEEAEQQAGGKTKKKVKNITTMQPGKKKEEEDDQGSGDAIMDRILKKKSVGKKTYFK